MFKHLINVIASRLGLMPVADHVELLADATHDVAAIEAELDATRVQVALLKTELSSTSRHLSMELERMWAQKEAAA